MKKVCCLIYVLFFFSVISGLKITEVELNPTGSDAGKEWIEFFSEEEINLSDYKIVNNDEDELFLEGNFSGYFVYPFPKQWFDNSNESVFLYKGEELIKKTIILEDSKNDDMTWQFCDEWTFLKETKGKEGCKKEEVKEEKLEKEKEEEILEEEIIKEEKETKEIKKVTEIKIVNNSTSEKIVKTPEIIKLNSNKQKNINSEPNIEERENNYAIYGFILFSIFIACLLIFRRKSLYKNEFR